MNRLLKRAATGLCLLLALAHAYAQAHSNVTLLGQISANPNCRVTAAGNWVYVGGMANGVRVVNVNNPFAPVLATTWDTPVYTQKIALSGHYAYVADNIGGMIVVDVTNPAAPQAVRTLTWNSAVQSVTIDGHYAYATATNNLSIFDISDPANPVLRGRTYQLEAAQETAISGSYAYVANGWRGLRIIDISNPAAPQLVGSFEVGIYLVEALAVRYPYVYFADWTHGVRILDISNPALPVEVGSCVIPDAIHGMALSGHCVYLASNALGLQVINISNPQRPAVVGYYITAGSANDIVVDGHYAYVADSPYFGVYDVQAAIDNPLPVELLSFTATPGDRRVTLAWRTASEEDVARFEIMRDGVAAASVNGHGTSTSEQNYTWQDDDAINGHTYRYTLVAVSSGGAREELQSVTAMPAITLAVVTDYALHAAYPNPFNPTTTISYDLAQAGLVTLAVYDLIGRRVATLVNATETAGRHSVAFDATGLPSGMYVCRLETGGFAAMQKMVLLK